MGTWGSWPLSLSKGLDKIEVDSGKLMWQLGHWSIEFSGPHGLMYCAKSSDPFANYATRLGLIIN